MKISSQSLQRLVLAGLASITYGVVAPLAALAGVTVVVGSTGESSGFGVTSITGEGGITNFELQIEGQTITDRSLIDNNVVSFNRPTLLRLAASIRSARNTLTRLVLKNTFVETSNRAAAVALTGQGRTISAGSIITTRQILNDLLAAIRAAFRESLAALPAQEEALVALSSIEANSLKAVADDAEIVGSSKSELLIAQGEVNEQVDIEEFLETDQEIADTFSETENLVELVEIAIYGYNQIVMEATLEELKELSADEDFIALGQQLREMRDLLLDVAADI